MWLKKNVKKQIQIFGKDFSVKNSKKNVSRKKKILFDFLFNSYSSWKTDKLDPKTRLNYKNDVFTSYQ